MVIEEDNGKMLVPASMAIVLVSWLTVILAGNFLNRPTQVKKYLSKSKNEYTSLKWSLAINRKNSTSILFIKSRGFSIIGLRFLRLKFI